MKRFITVFSLTIVMLLSGVVDVKAQQEMTSYQRALKNYFEASGVMEGLEVILPQMMNMMSEIYPSVDKKWWEWMEQEMRVELIDHVIDMYEDVYKPHLTEEDLMEITAFYETPAGRKLAEATPVMRQGSMQRSKEMALRISEKIERKLQEEALIEVRKEKRQSRRKQSKE